LEKDVASSAGDDKFWTALENQYDGIWETLTSCARSVPDKDREGKTAILRLSFLLSDFRGNVLSWLLDKLSEQHKELRKEMKTYAEESEKYQEAQRNYIGKLESYARDSLREQGFLQTLALLKALTPPRLPQVTSHLRSATERSPGREPRCALHRSAHDHRADVHQLLLKHGNGESG
jgi:hypothetical protein